MSFCTTRLFVGCIKPTFNLACPFLEAPTDGVAAHLHRDFHHWLYIVLRARLDVLCVCKFYFCTVSDHQRRPSWMCSYIRFWCRTYQWDHCLQSQSLHTLRHHHRHPEQSNKDSLFTLYLAFFIFAKYKSTKRQFICGHAPTFNLCFRFSAASKWVFLLQDCTSMKTNFRFSASPPVLTCYYFHIIIVVRPITKCTGYIYPLLEPHDSFNRILVLLGVVVDAVYRGEWIICDWPSFWRVRHFG